MKHNPQDKTVRIRLLLMKDVCAQQMFYGTETSLKL